MAGKKAAETTTKAKAKPRKIAPAKKTAAPVVELTPAPIVRQKKSIFSAGTVITLLLLIALIEFSIYFNREKEKKVIAEATPISEPTTLFSTEYGNVSGIEVKPTDGENVKVERNAENAWVVKMPIEGEANQGLAEAAAAQVSALTVISQIEDGKSPSDYGLDTPAYVITIKFESGKESTIEVGDATPTNSGYYVRLDMGKMMITDLSGIDALLQLRFFPPYLNTPTPLPPTLTPVPATKAVSTPVP
jgi:hypothetical protein